MSIQSLTPPQDITWKRMAFSRDMVDTNFDDVAFPPKWRTSLTVYYYLVPEEETADAYPESRIVYLKLSCSITGWNPWEGLQHTKQEASESDQWDDLQKSIWAVIEASSWASKYWGCYGAIMQIGVFPSKDDQVGPEEYPYVVDFEPKKRELFDQVTAGSELLAGSSDKLSVTKGSTNTQSAEVSAGGSFMGIGASASMGAQWQQVDSRTTDTSRENRETLSYTSSFSQLYQPFTGYHLGTNRAVFVVAPRPHTMSGDFNLIDGERKLEGIQDMFLVISMPRSLKGFCIHASIDTGHKHPDEQAASSNVRKAYALRTVDFSDPPCMGGEVWTPPQPPGGGGGGGGGTPPPDGEGDGFSFIVTRRRVQACGQFNEQGQLILKRLPAGTPPEPPQLFMGEAFIPTRAVAGVMARTITGGGPEGGFDDCRPAAVARYNYNLSRMNKAMVSMFSAGAASPKPLKETTTFKTLFVEAATQLKVDLEQLHRLEYISDDELRLLQQYRVSTLSDLFKPSTENIGNINLNAIRNRIVKKGDKDQHRDKK
jgi:hypothetical protein